MRFILAMPDWFNIKKPISIIHYINRLRNKIHIIILIDEEKASDKIIKTPRKLGIEENFLHLKKNIYMMMKHDAASCR